jgi:transposase
MQVKINKAFKFRLELTEEQNERFRQSAGASRFAYNYALARKKTLYQETGKSITSGEIQKRDHPDETNSRIRMVERDSISDSPTIDPEP